MGRRWYRNSVSLFFGGAGGLEGVMLVIAGLNRSICSVRIYEGRRGVFFVLGCVRG